MTAQTTRVLALVGSLRTGSHNLSIAQAAAAGAPEGTQVEIFHRLGELPFYSEDLDTTDTLPATARELRAAAGAAHAILLVTPEYNGTMPAVLKNAIDWLSRPFGAGAIKGLPVAVAGTSAGQYGGVWAHDEARRSVGIAGAKVVADATLAVGGAYQRFAATAPADDAEVVEAMAAIVERLGREAATAAA